MEERNEGFTWSGRRALWHIVRHTFEYAVFAGADERRKYKSLIEREQQKATTMYKLSLCALMTAKNSFLTDSLKIVLEIYTVR